MAENIIFFGPPGTGKTYLLQSMMNDYIDYEITDEQIKRAYISNSEEWILITLVLLQHHGKMLASDIQAKVSLLNLGTQTNVAVELEQHSIGPAPIIGVKRAIPRIFTKLSTGEWYVDFVRVQQNRPDFYSKFLSESKVSKRYSFVTFHQSYSYEDFIEGIRPEYIEASKSVDYSPKPGVFKLLCEEAREHPEKQYAIFIDEINRGNISEIFGELISLIETDKREGETGALSAILPYSKKIFSVPLNVNLYGTMNTADRSIAQIDLALRRRFNFKPMLPDSDIIRKEFELKGVDATNIEGIDLIKLVDTMNSRIEILLDSQHLLGHALFMTATSIKKIAETIRGNIIPLLEEYFYDDPQKIQLIFNDIDEDGDLREDAIYVHTELSVDSYFNYIGEYLLEDKKHFMVSKDISKKSLEHVYK